MMHVYLPNLDFRFHSMMRIPVLQEIQRRHDQDPDPDRMVKHVAEVKAEVFNAVDLIMSDLNEIHRMAKGAK